MHRFGKPVVALAACLLLFGAERGFPLDVLAAHKLQLDVERMALSRIAPLAGLKPVAGWELDSKDPAFGGWSAIVPSRGGLLLVGDAGAVLELRFQDGGISHQASIRPLPAGCATQGEKRMQDAEAAAADPVTGRVWLGFEWNNRLCEADSGLSQRQRSGAPIALKRLPKMTGPEGIAVRDDGSILVFAEQGRDWAAVRPLIHFGGDPLAKSARATAMGYLPPSGFSPSDAAALPDGGLLVINRSFSPWRWFRAELGYVPAFAPKRGLVLRAKPLGQILPAENYEGVAVTRRHGRTFVWIVSDDNFLSLQRTRLLLYEYRGRDAPPASGGS